MITAKNSRVSRFFFNIYIDNLLSRYFSEIILCNEPPKIEDDKPLLILPNHISWWDGFFIYKIFRKYFRKNFYLMMLENELKKFIYFRNVGAFSINQGDVKSVLQTFRYIKDLLSSNNNAVVFYPQGKIEDFNNREYSFYKGIDYLIRSIDNDISILPVSFKIQYYNVKKPYILVRFSEIIDGKSKYYSFDFLRNKFIENVKTLQNDSEEKKVHKSIKL